jgi:hypothetical protein
MYRKLGAWQVLVALSTSQMMIMVVRMTVYVLIWCVCDLWILLKDEYLGILDSFKPFNAFEWTK